MNAGGVVESTLSSRENLSISSLVRDSKPSDRDLPLNRSTGYRELHIK